MTDPHVMQPGHAPTPFTADEIRSATPAGHTVETVTEHAGAVTRWRTEFTDVDVDRVVMVSTPIDERGRPTGQSREVAASWTDLQSHASFPNEITSRTTDKIDTPLGTISCIRYDVKSKDHTNTFWFSPMHPGMPIRTTTDAAEAPTTTVVSIIRS